MCNDDLYMHSVGLALLVSTDGHFPEPYRVERATIEAPRFCNMVWNLLNKLTHSEIHESYYPNEYQIIQQSYWAIYKLSSY